MNHQSIWEEIEWELMQAKKKHPNWPEHIVARAAIVVEEAGELVRAALNHKYESPTKFDKDEWMKQMRKEAIHTAATAIIFLESLK